MLALKVLFVRLGVRHLGPADGTGVDERFLRRGLLVRALALLHLGLLLRVLLLTLKFLLSSRHLSSLIPARVARAALVEVYTTPTERLFPSLDTYCHIRLQVYTVGSPARTVRYK